MPKAKNSPKEVLARVDAQIAALQAYRTSLIAIMKSGTNVALPDIGGLVRKKPGPKPGFKKAAQQAAPKKKGPAAKKAATAAPPKKKAGAKKAATAAPPKKSGIPRLIDALQLVMAPTIGKKSTMGAVDCHTELKRRHWLPQSDDPLGYVRYTLSANKDIFRRDPNARGQYFLDKPASGGKAKTKTAPTAPKSAPKVEPEVKATEETKVEAKVETKVEAAPPPVQPKAAPPPAPPKAAAQDEDPSAVADEILKSAGIDMSGSNPFA